NCVRPVHRRTPAADRAILCREDKSTGAGLPTLCHDELRRPVEHDPSGCRRTTAARGGRDGHNKRGWPWKRLPYDCSVQRRNTGVIVGNPEWACGTEGDAPGIEQIRITKNRVSLEARHVRNQIELLILPCNRARQD